MIKYYLAKDGQIFESTSRPKTLENLVWIDMLYPSSEEEREVELLIYIDTPTLEEMSEIELSSRLYVENGTIYTTASLVTNFEKDPESNSITFIFKDKILITVRYSEPKSFALFLNQCSKQKQSPIQNGVDVFIGITEAIIDRLSDALELIGRELDSTSKNVFQNNNHNNQKNDSADLQEMLKKIGRYGDLNGKFRESLLTLSRQMSYLLLVGGKNKQDHIEDLETYVKDLNALSEHTNYISNRINLLLDAILGMINIEQNAIIKFFSVAAAVFLPPTLIASIYGMNFKHMPELDLKYGYPIAISLMLFSAIGPYIYFRKKRWL